MPTARPAAGRGRRRPATDPSPNRRAAQCAELDSPELSLPLVNRVIDRSREATARAARLSAPSQAARNARVLFHCPAGGGPSGGRGAPSAGGGEDGGGAHPGCLLEQLARWAAFLCLWVNWSCMAAPSHRMC